MTLHEALSELSQFMHGKTFCLTHELWSIDESVTRFSTPETYSFTALGIDVIEKSTSLTELVENVKKRLQ